MFDTYFQDIDSRNGQGLSEAYMTASAGGRIGISQDRSSADLPPLERFTDWIRCICVVTFDLELGQVIETIYPGNVEITPQEKLNICYMAFPDSNSGCTQDTTYHFRTKQFHTPLTPAQEKFCREAPTFLHIDANYLYGFVHFRQKKNPNLPRGYYQKSLVVLTVLPLFSLFYHVVDMIAAQFFESGEAAIEAGCHHIDHWKSPEPGKILSLPFMGSVFHCRIPWRDDKLQKHLHIDPNIVKDVDGTPMVLPTIHETNFYESLKGSLNHLQMLWELVLLNEPVVVMAPTPEMSSQIIQSLCSIIWPLNYATEVRPFFTIHDSDFLEITSKVYSNGILLGLTNPFFSKTLCNWPHILCVGDANGGQPLTAEKHYKKPWDGKTLDSKPGFYSQYKQFLHTDKSLSKKLVNVGSRPDNVQNAILRRHFLELTQCFLIPLERYLSTLIPLRKHISPFQALPQVKPFIFDDFLLILQQAAPILGGGIKGDVEGLYRRFVSSPNFDQWFKSRLEDVDRQLRDTHLEVLCTTNLSKEVISTREQVEIVDLVLKIQDKLKDLDGKNIEKRRKLHNQLNSVMGSIDDELKSLLLSNGALRETFEL